MSTPDFRACVRRHLPSLPQTPAAHEEGIVEELAAQLEDAYETALAGGLDEQQALQQVMTELQRDSASWRQLDAYLRARVALPSSETSSWSSTADRFERSIGELRSAARRLSRDARFTIAVALTLSVCIGVNAAVFAVVDAVLLRPLPFPESDRVVLMASQSAPSSSAGIRSDVPSYFDRVQQLSVFEDTAMFCWIDVSIDTPRGPQRIRGDVGTPSLLRLIGVAPLHGRLFHEQEGVAGAEQKVILSYELWQDISGGDPAIVGTDLPLNGRPFTVVGVMPEGFGLFRLDARFWIPAVYSTTERADDRRGWLNQYQIGRLRAGATLEDAQQELAASDAAVLDRLAASGVGRQRPPFWTSVHPLRDVMIREVRPILQLLWGGALLVLLVGVVNTATLTFARARRNGRELVTRLALGARRGHIIRHLLAEGLLLGVLSGVGGVLLGIVLLSLLTRVGLQQLPRAAGVHMDVTTGLIAAGAALLAGLVIGFAPGVGLVSANLSRTMRSATRSRTGDKRAAILRRALVTMQVGAAFVLVTGAGLLLVSFWNLLGQKPGFNADGVLTASFDIPAERYPAAADAQRFVDRALDAIRALPGVESAGVTQLLPFGGRTAAWRVRAADAIDNATDSWLAWNYVISPGYLETMEVPLVAGRHFNERDRPDGQPAVIIDEALARRLWPGVNPLGRQLLFPQVVESRALTVIGIVGDVRQADLGGGDARGAAYRLHTQVPMRPGVPDASRTGRAYTAAIRARAVVEPAVRAAMQSVDAELPLYDVNPMAARVDSSLAPRRLSLTLGSIFGATALLLAVMGLYALLTYMATERRREFGIRLALGSSVRGVVLLVVREAAVLTTVGLLVGIAGTVSLRDLVQRHVYRIDAMDLRVIAASTAVLVLVSVVACVAPGRRVARVAPATVLEQE